MSDSNKPEKDINGKDDILGSDDLFDLDMPDLDMPIDEPEENISDELNRSPENSSGRESVQDISDEFPESEQQQGDQERVETTDSVQSLENDLEQLLDRTKTDEDKKTGSLYNSGTPDTDPAITETLTPPDLESVTAEPAEFASDTITEAAAAPKSDKMKFGMPNSLMLTLGLVAILIAAMASWLGLDATEKIGNLETVSPRLQQQIKELEQRQKQQNKALTNQIETLQLQINTLTNVIANKTTEQWRRAIEKTAPALHKQHTVMPNKVISQKPVPTQPVHVQPVAAKKEPTGSNKLSAPATITPKKAVHTASSTPKSTITRPHSPLGNHEVPPGSVKGWVVNIYSVESQNSAERQIRQLALKDIHAEYVRVPVKGKIWYRIRVSGFKNERSAVVFNKFLKEYHGIAGTWYNKLK